MAIHKYQNVMKCTKSFHHNVFQNIPTHTKTRTNTPKVSIPKYIYQIDIHKIPKCPEINQKVSIPNNTKIGLFGRQI
jgi:hypothetical protein